ncbi:ABATE domain-containing protein [Roseovarius sp. M141]|uniref:CGNR zinc finger domain-containing protein n=1 Tax=Roseovarius sp. M141 TaxID=2583806 RepID=UPI0020CF6913|nr:ABATE domain-containing protein [Roseovarius sp. M141]MCQ0090255.1 hypothetical protein [Roseovarius sp. M141]
MPSRNIDFHTETGRLSLDWIATLGDRHGTPLERMRNPADLERWLTAVAGQVVARKPTGQNLVAARRLRAALVGLVDRLHSSQSPVVQDIEILNEFAALPPPVVQLGVTGKTLEKNDGLDASAVFGMIARDGIDLLTGGDFAKVRLCAGEDCSVYFVDHSRPGKRRWCSMGRCGNKAKKRAFTERSLRNRQSVY